ncbi:hypothetical protein HU200_018460 [Digitaria exilis]|uniref:LysM domain-containing protein n=1 Tax=Digitaria exilis TaxID=1010633 RepID=A0A835F475_9POAL|nr:hypothetical protein HU200_018460 [Digitaria exilis]
MARERRQRSSADVASWCCVLALVLLVGSLASSGVGKEEEERGLVVVRGSRLTARPCEELYVVAEGETLHSISARCGDPYILERNPHVHDPDDVFPGLVIKIITPRADGNPK